MRTLTAWVGVGLAALAACNSTTSETKSPDAGGTPADGGACTRHLQPSPDVQTSVQAALIEARAGDVLCFDAGTYLFTDELSVSTRNITIRGTAGAVWDFRNQRATARNGLLATGDGFTIEDLTILNTAGDGVRVEGASHVVFRRLVVRWEEAALRKDDAGIGRTGAYAVYPVKCDGVLIEDTDVSGARDAALYVGQSKNAVVRNNKVYDSVAGIEIENTQDSDVYGNRVYGNTAGILVFNMPDLPVQDGRRASVHDNVIEKNNRENFGIPGTTVAGVPRGIGVLVMAASQTDVRANTIQDHDSTGVLIVSCFTNNGLKDCTSTTPGYYQYPQAAYVHDNTFARNGKTPDPSFGPVGQATLEDILWDGDVDPAKKDDPALRQCIKNAGATFRNFGSRSTFATQSTDLAPHQCEHPPLPAVTP